MCSFTIKASASGGLRPSDPLPGLRPGPRWGTSVPQIPSLPLCPPNNPVRSTPLSVYVLTFLLSVSLITGIVYLIVLILAVFFIVLNVPFKVLILLTLDFKYIFTCLVWATVSALLCLFVRFYCYFIHVYISCLFCEQINGYGYFRYRG